MSLVRSNICPMISCLGITSIFWVDFHDFFSSSICILFRCSASWGILIRHNHSVLIILWGGVLDILVLGRKIFQRSSGCCWAQVLPDHCLNINDHCLWSWKCHENILLLHVAPAGKHRDVGKEEEDMSPLGTLEVEGVAHVHDQQHQHHQEEGHPGQEEVPPPSPYSMTGKAIRK